jgi:hypothetical protein
MLQTAATQTIEGLSLAVANFPQVGADRRIAFCNE